MKNYLNYTKIKLNRHLLTSKYYKNDIANKCKI